MKPATPLAWAAVAAYAAALVFTMWPESAPWSLIAVASIATRRPFIILLSATVLLTALASTVHLPQHTSSDTGHPHVFTVVLTSAAHTPPRNTDEPTPPQFSADVRITAVNGHPAGLDARMTANGDILPAWGDRLDVVGTLDTAPPGRPRSLLLRVDRIETREPAHSLLAATESLRSQFRSAAARVPGRGGELVTGLAIGDTRTVSAPLANALRVSSLTHLTAVSGSNCALIAAAVSSIAAAAGASRRVRIVAALAALAGFVLLVTPQPSVLRAATMATIALVSLHAGRPRTGLAALALTTLVLLLGDPWLAWNLGFALSVAASAGLILLSRPLSERLRPRLGRCAPLVAIPLAAQLACTPIVLLVNPNLSPWGIPANILAGWCAPIATSLGVIACLVLPVMPWLGQVMTTIAAVPAAAIAHIALGASRLPGAQIPWPTGAVGFSGGVVFTVVLLALLLSRRTWVRRSLSLATTVCAALMFGFLGIAPILRSTTRPANWVIADCSVGQGDAFVIRSAGMFGLIDTGPDPDQLHQCLDDLGVTHISLLVLTHYDRDHVAGVPAIVGRVDRALVGPVGDASDQQLRDRLRRGGADVSEARRGDTGMFGDSGYTVLWPNGTTDPGNDSSVTLALTLGGVSVIFLGDLGADAQSALLRAGAPAQVDVVKVAHHGSADQASELYAQLHARIGLIGVGPNRYGHPTQRLLELLQHEHTRAYRSDTNGLVLVAPAADHGIQVWSERPSDSEQ